MEIITKSTVLLLLYAAIKVIGAQRGLYMSNATHILQNDPGSKELTVIVARPKGRIVGVAVDSRGGFIFWSDISHEERGIYRSYMNGNAVQRIVSTDIGEINGLSVDWVSQHVYWTDATRKSVEVADYDGGNRRKLPLYGLQQPRGVVADPINGWLYWNDQGSRNIVRSRPDGSEQTNIVETGLYWPNHMVAYKNKLYWVDGWNKTLSVCNHDGSWRHHVASMVKFSEDNPVFGLAINNDVAYVSVWNKGKIYAVDLETGQVKEYLLGVGYEALFGLAYYSLTLQPQGSNECGREDRNGCSHLCLPTGRLKGRCACPSAGGLALYDNRQCREAGALLIYALAGQGEVGFTAPDSSSPADRYTIAASPRPVAVAYDSYEQVVYWSDVRDKAIYSSRLDGSRRFVFLNSSSGIGIVDGMTMDVQERRLYFSNMGFVRIQGTTYSWHKIEMISLDRRERTVVVSSASRPRGLFLDPGRYLYYTDWGNQAGVYRVNLDGSDPVPIRTGMDNPNAVLLLKNDYVIIDSHDKSRTQPHYPTRKRDGGLYTVKVDGQGWAEKRKAGLKTPFALTANKDTLYISDWKEGAVIALEPDGTTNHVISHVDTPAGLVFSQRSTPFSNRGNMCSQTPVARSVCSAICHRQPDGQTGCSCSTYGPEVLSSDLLTCTEAQEFALMTDFNTVKMIPFYDKSGPPRDILYGDNNRKEISAMTYEPSNQMLYYVDSKRNVIFSKKINAEEDKENFMYNLGETKVSGLTISQSDNRIYWLEATSGVIGSTLLSGNSAWYQEVASGLDTPTAIFYHNNYIYWTESGASPRAARVSVTSGVVQELTRDLQQPSAVFVQDHLYVADAGRGIITKCNVDGTNCKMLKYLNPIPSFISGIWKAGDWLYYTDSKRGSLIAVHVNTGQSWVIKRNLMKPQQLFLRLSSLQQTCPRDHGCGDLCLPTPSGFVCGCRPGRRLGSDGKTCTTGVGIGGVEAEAWRCDVQCPDGAVCSRISSTVQYQCRCRAGYQTDAATCQACPKDTFNPYIGTGRCQSCPPGSTTTGPASAACSCPPPQVWNDNTLSCADQRTGECPACSRQAVRCVSPCAADGDCPPPQRCCSQSPCLSKVCVAPLLDGLCVFNTSTYQPGQVYTSDVCTTCMCTRSNLWSDRCDSRAVCRRRECPPTPCGGRAKLEPGRCCPTCPRVIGLGQKPGNLIFTKCPSGTITLELPTSEASHVAFDDGLRYYDRLRRSPDLIRVVRKPAHTMFSWKGRGVEQEVEVTVQAQDGSGDQDSCSYKLIVRDKQKPKMSCPSKNMVVKQTTDTEAAVFFRVTAIDPGSGLLKNNPKPADPDKVSGATFPVGLHEVTYKATDKAGNQQGCTFNVKVLAFKDEKKIGCKPINVYRGTFQCDHGANFSTCSVVCQPGLETNTIFPEDIACYNKEFIPRLPSSYGALACVDVKDWRMQLPMQIVLNETFPEDILTPDYIYGIRSGFFDAIQPLDNQKLVKAETVVVRKVQKQIFSSRTKRQNLSVKIILEFSAEGSYHNTKSGKETQGELNALYRRLDEAVNSTSLVIEANGQFLLASRLQRQDFRLGCQQGQQATLGGCFECPVGTYHDVRTGNCSLCSPGTYQDEDGQTACKACPKGLSSHKAAFACFDPSVTSRSRKDRGASLPMTLIIIIAACVGGVLILILLTTLAIFLCRKKSRKRKKQDEPLEVSGIGNPAYMQYGADDAYDHIPADNDADKSDKGGVNEHKL